MNSAVNIILFIAIHFISTAEKVLTSEKLQIYLKTINYTLVILMKICIIMLDYHKKIFYTYYTSTPCNVHVLTYSYNLFHVRYMYFYARNYKHYVK